MIRPVLILLASLGGVTLAADEPQRPNLLWITCEDTSPTLGCYGDAYAVTPNLDALAGRGVRYTHCFTHAGVCAPSRSGLITGMYPTSLGSHHMRSVAILPAGVRTLGAWLRDTGYYCTNNAKTDYNFAVPKDAWDESSRRAHWRNRRPGQPFFSVFNFIGTHESRIRGEFDRTAHNPSQAALPPYMPDTPVVRRDWARYHDLVTEMDREVGRLLAQLDEDGLASETIVFFFSDHGVGLPRAKQWIWEAGLHTPLIIRFPERYRQWAPAMPGAAVDDLVSFVDFAPTMLSLAGVPIPKVMQGVAFLGSQAGPPREYVYGIRDRMDERYDMQRSVRDRCYKYFRNYMPQLPYAPNLDYMELLPTMQEWRRLAASGSLAGPAALFMQTRKPVEELYDLEADPHELHNLAGSADHQGVLKRLREAHLVWVRQSRDLGLLPEQQMHDRAVGQPHFEMARRDDSFPVGKILEAALLVGRRDDALGEMTAALAHRDAAIRFWSAVALGSLGPQAGPAESALRTALSDSSAEVGIMAASALSQLRDDNAALTTLIKALDHASPWVRLRAANVLDQIGEKARPALAIMRQRAVDESHENRYVAWVLRNALRKFEPETPDSPLIDVGVAHVDITPSRVIRLSGYGRRREPSTGVAQRLWAKAIAFGCDDEKPAVLITTDLIGVPAWLSDEVAARLARDTAVERSRMAICATHTHTGPVVKGTLPFIFGETIPAAQQAVIDEFARTLADHLEHVARTALASRRPGRIGLNHGHVDFANNRRLLTDGRWSGFGANREGPVDHHLPLLRITEPDGRLRAVLLTYACHCTTYGGDFNQIHGDWAGVAQERIEAAHPGVVAMVSIGCGADANPHPRGGTAEVLRHGQTIADEVQRLLTLPARWIGAPPQCRFRRLELPLATIPARSYWEQAAQGRGREAFYARVVLDRLNRGVKLPTNVPYCVQTWTFGDDLAMVFLAGEVVVDFSIRLKSQFAADKLWIHAYANDLPCYIVSRRVILEGGYEVERSMDSYDKPACLDVEAEELIIDSVRELLPQRFKVERPTSGKVLKDR